jgi:hypothetical protein
MIQILKQNKELRDLFTRREEYTPLFLAQYGRFLYYLSKHRNILEPEVSKFLIENGLNVEYPGNKKFAVCLTHNIDVVYPYTSKLGIVYITLKSLKERQIKNTLKISK